MFVQAPVRNHQMVPRCTLSAVPRENANRGKPERGGLEPSAWLFQNAIRISLCWSPCPALSRKPGSPLDFLAFPHAKERGSRACLPLSLMSSYTSTSESMQGLWFPKNSCTRHAICWRYNCNTILKEATQRSHPAPRMKKLQIIIHMGFFLLLSMAGKRPTRQAWLS